jgi:ferric-dicitrate binding protein FerR (iron transport regulator)
MLNETIFRELVEAYMAGEITPENRRLLATALEQEEYLVILESLVAEAFFSNSFHMPETPALGSRLTELLEQKTGLQLAPQPAVKRSVIARMGKWVAAAVLLFVIAGVSYLLWKPAPVTGLQSQAQRFKNDVQPGHAGAILTLANGSKMQLDTMRDGVVVTENGLVIQKENGVVSYRQGAGAAASRSVAYNTIETGTGNRYRLQLADGTVVWLNAESEVHYPLSFTGTERWVQVKGEVYMEVAPDAARPFKVQLEDSSQVQVLGTRFNINGYHNNAIRTTLLQGSVQLAGGGQLRKLLPGQRGGFNSSGRLIAESDVNTEKITAWVNNDFYFEGDDIESVMETLARWYGITIKYQVKPSGGYTGIVSRNAGLKEVLGRFEQLGDVRFIIEGKNITVLKE